MKKKTETNLENTPPKPKLLTRPSTPARTAAARANGAKSRGPVTPAGKLNSRRNALKHGQHAETLTLDRESDDQFALLLAALEAEHQPRTDTERDLVLRIAHARWCALRLWSQEKSIFNEAMEEVRRAAREPALRSADCSGRAFRKLAESGPVLSLIQRHDHRYERAYYRAMRELSRLREAPYRLIRLQQLVLKNATTNPSTISKQTSAEKTNPSLMQGWRPSEELERRIAEKRGQPPFSRDHPEGNK